MTKWDERFLALAKHVASWSKDPSTQCGAVIVDTGNRILGIGYNGFPRHVDDSPERYADRETKYRLVVHAEANAILNSHASVEGAAIYVWPFPPCCECAKLLVQAGIDFVVAPRPSAQFLERWSDSFVATRLLFEESGVLLELVDA